MLPRMSIKLLMNAMPHRLSLLDVGARGGVQWPWSNMPKELLSAVLIEPDPNEASRLQQQLDQHDCGKVLSVALWREESKVELYLNRAPGTSSVFPPNKQVLKDFPEFGRFDVLEIISISANTIDGLVGAGRMPDIDFAKLDVQGAELAVLEGGLNHLSANLVGLEVEVEFAELYSGQPLFGDVDRFIREKLGLELWDLRGTYWKHEKGMHRPGPTKGRLVFGDALYLRPIDGLESWFGAMSLELAQRKLSALVLSALAYGYVDYAAAVLELPFAQNKTNASLREALSCAVNGMGSGFRPFRNGNGYIYSVFGMISKAFKPIHNGWATGDEALGSRRRGFFWW